MDSARLQLLQELMKEARTTGELESSLEGNIWTWQSTQVWMTRGTMICFDGIVDVEVYGICFA